MIERLCAPYDQLRVERVNNGSALIVRERDVPELRAVGVQREQLNQVLNKIMDAIGTDVGLREDVVGVRCREGPQLTATGRVGRENRMHTAVRPDGGLHAGIELRQASWNCEHGRTVEAQCTQMVVGVKIQLLLAAIRTEHNLRVIHD